MQVLIYGRDTELVEQLMRQEGIAVVTASPDVIVTHGGDGLLLEAERRYPGVPKLPIRRNSICKTCVDHDTSHVIRALARGTITRSSVMKLQARFNGQTYTALNEFSLHHVKPQQAIRYRIQLNDDQHTVEAIGDGLIVATPFGSHAYYRSVTKGTFHIGIGLAFNNTTEPIDHMVIHPEDTIRVTVTRGPVYFLADNDDSLPQLTTGDTIEISQATETATLLGLDHYHCPDCGMLESVIVGEERK
jgi:NAD+ kinase